MQTTTATVRGSVHDDDDSVWVWKGVRYAAAPVGDLRFRPAAPAACETEVQDARSDPPQCLQLGPNFAPPSEALVVGSEDCLFLNVFRPERRDHESSALLPVLFFIHGGGQIMAPAGRRRQPLRWRPARAGVPDRRRVDQLPPGRPGLPRPPALARDGVVGNWAHHDVLAALQWTHDNIAGFGGDPRAPAPTTSA